MKTSKRENKGGEPNPQWTSIEVVRYYLFMMLKMQDILAFHRKTRNIFKEMSAFVTSRTQEQCKSHHQKKAITGTSKLSSSSSSRKNIGQDSSIRTSP